MSKFPDGNFTIVNNETGRCVRVRLGKTKDVSDYREGTKYLQYVTTKPTLELGIPDNSPATAWWFSTINDGVERQPFNQIVNFAVDEYQNIGRYCVWMYTDSLSNNDDRAHSEEVYVNKLNNAPADLRAKLDALIPDEWNTWYAERNSRMVEHWKEAPQERLRVKITAEMEAWAADEEPLGAEKLAQLKAIREREIEHIEAQQRRDEEADRLRRRRKAPEPFDETAGLSEEDRALLEEIGRGPRAARIRSRTKELLPAVKERRNKDLELKWQRLLPVATLESWHRNCAVLAFYADGGIRLSGDYETPLDKRVAAAIRVYMEAASKEGIKPSVMGKSGARTKMYGCGASRGGSSTYRWVYDGTHIYGADSTAIPSERTYWTDEDGRLVGKNKGGPGQTWTLASWKPTAPAADPVRAVTLTGLFGPLGIVLGM
ncbi:hypothetical protein [Streptomyces sp. or20]|uniref:hypothetical protein n=1 Tax=Streptomyces sp. or20 TaxID=1828016 RepID=UPI000BF0E6DD|nr:hypothetical protein [Streptomyces sp. or20]